MTCDVRLAGRRRVVPKTIRESDTEPSIVPAVRYCFRATTEKGAVSGSVSFRLIQTVFGTHVTTTLYREVAVLGGCLSLSVWCRIRGDDSLDVRLPSKSKKRLTFLKPLLSANIAKALLPDKSGALSR